MRTAAGISATRVMALAVCLLAAWGATRAGVPVLVSLVLVGGAVLALVGLVVDHARARTARQRAAERLTVAADERARLAREMHDSLSKTLDAIALGAAALPGTLDEPDRASRLARTLRDSTLHAARDARNLIEDLRANAVDAPLRDLALAITEDWSATTGIAAATRCPPVDLPPPVIVELCGILREALHNVAAHADAATVTVTVAHDRDEVTLTVADDGTGFDQAGRRAADSARGHHGLVGMAERAKVCGGRLDVTSTPGTGTRVTAVVPVTGEAPARRRTPGPVAVGAAGLVCGALVAATPSMTGREPAGHRAAPAPSRSTVPSPGVVPSSPAAAVTPSRARATRTATPSRTPSPTAQAAVPVAGASGCHVRYTKRNEWDPGFIVDVTIENTGTVAVDGWTLDFTFAAGQTLVSSWSATVTQAGADVTASDGGISPTIAPGASVTFGLQGTWHGSDPVPPSFTLNDTRCA